MVHSWAAKRKRNLLLYPLCVVLLALLRLPVGTPGYAAHLFHLERHLARRSSYLAVAYTMTVVAIGLNLLTPLYGIYRQKFAFSALTLTLIFATYIVTIIPAMLVFGPLADAFGRRRILLVSALTAALAPVLLLAASSAPWLFAARIVQGIAQGAVSGAASAALLELGNSIKRTALVIGMTITGGIALGVLATCGIHRLGEAIENTLSHH